jgi:actin-related protein
MIENRESLEITEDAVVLDLGSYYLKAGYAGNDAPTTIFPNIMGRPLYDSTMLSTGKEFYVGNEAQNHRGILALSYPICNGVVRNFDDFEILLYHAVFEQLLTSVEDRPVLLTDPPLNPKSNREKITQLMFEKFNVPGTYFAFPAVLSHYASGRCTGITIEVGEGGTHVIPVYEGYTFMQAINRSNLGGGVITDYLGRLLLERGYSFTTSAGREIVRRIKESLGYVALDFDEEIIKSLSISEEEKLFILPDGNNLYIGNERFRCAEELFTPSYFGKDAKGIHELVFDSIIKCDIDTRKDFYGNIIVAGGSTKFDGLADRMAKEIINLAPKTVKVKVIAPPERGVSAWIGGSILASLSTFANQWLHRSEYEEHGPRIIHRKGCHHYM